MFAKPVLPTAVLAAAALPWGFHDAERTLTSALRAEGQMRACIWFT